MDDILPCLHPNPGWDEMGPEESVKSKPSSSIDLVGKHCILELYECDQFRLNDEAFLRTTITSATKFAGATLLNLITHRFQPHGVTGLALLAESHMSIHTWPEHGYAAVDVFTCGDHTMPERACEFLRKELLSQKYCIKSISREVPKTLKREISMTKSIELGKKIDLK